MALSGKVVVFTRLHDATVSTAVSTLQQKNPNVPNVHVVHIADASDLSQAIATNLKDKASDEFDGVVMFNEDTALLSTELHAIAPYMKAGGVLQLYVADAEEDKKNSILMALMIGGFVETADSEDQGAGAFYPQFAKARCYSSKKPAFETGSSATIPLTKKTTTTTQPLKKWTVVADDFDDDDDDDIIDEDTLLDDTDEVLKAAKDDCGTGVGGKRRACKNCTCGRKDEEDKPVVSDKELSQMVSSCGNCFKGDAFRCGSCPFLGKPAFKPGMEKVMLNLDSDDF